MMKFIIHHYVIVMIFHIIYAHNEDVGYIPASKLIVNGIIDKINGIVTFVQSKAIPENKDELLNNIERKLMNAAKALGPRGEKDVKLIMEGIKIKTSNITHDGRRSNNEIIQNNVNNRSITLEELSHNFDILLKSKLNKYEKQNKKIIAGDLKQNVLEFIRNNRSGHISNHSRRIAEFITNKKYSINDAQQTSDEKYYKDDDNDASSVDFKTTSDQPKSQTANIDICNNVYGRICSYVKNLNSFKCLYDDVAVSLEKLCDNSIDCPDRSDEKACNTHVMNKVESANRVMADVESSLENHCFEVDINKSSLKKHTLILQDVLQAQLHFKDKYLNYSLTRRSKDSNNINNDNEMLKRSANEIALIISSLALALNGALCAHDVPLQESTNDIFKSNFDQDINDIVWPPKSCECRKAFCFNCTDMCRRICWHKHSLTRWNCESLSNTDSVTMNAICDGKLDCFDESDEIDCVEGTGYSKFQATEIYGNIVEVIQSRASKEHISIRKKLLSLSKMIIKLQEITTKLDPNRTQIKTLRNNCYLLLSSLYSDMLSRTHFVSESEEAYVFLSSLNKNLASALKRSHTGNKRIIADGCYCRHGICVASNCPKTCVKACSVESKITKYRCQDGNASVSVDDICDGKRDCPNGYDEQECQNDVICRRHHLVLLRHQLQEIGTKFKGTSLGELIESWKIKVTSTIKIAEKSNRPKPKAFKKIMKNMLRDLVLTYGSVENYKRSNKDYALDDFIIIAQQIMSTLKSCGI